jgi:hypothetical protein
MYAYWVIIYDCQQLLMLKILADIYISASSDGFKRASVVSFGNSSGMVSFLVPFGRCYCLIGWHNHGDLG